MRTRVPTPSRHRQLEKFERQRPAASAKDDAVALRLAIGRDGIGLELARPARFACVRVTDLAATLPGVRFPVDVSGGVARFRHRRGALTRLEIEVGARALERWAGPRLRGIVGAQTPEVSIVANRSMATVCVAAATHADDGSPATAARPPGIAPLAPPAAPVVAFDLHVLAEADDLVLVVSNARGIDLPGPATAIAMASVDALLGRSAERRGALFTLRRVAATIARALLPEAGARVPSTGAAVWCAIAAHGDTWI